MQVLSPAAAHVFTLIGRFAEKYERRASEA
jgi:hypothetical protein